MPTVFISHSSLDDQLCTKLQAWMARCGFTEIFADHSSIRIGDRWKDELRAAKGSSRIVLCLVTANWLASDESYGEFLAGWYSGKRIIPALCLVGDLDEKSAERLRRILGEDQGVDLTKVGAPATLDFSLNEDVARALDLGLRAAGAMSKVGVDPSAFEVDRTLRPQPFPGLESFSDDDCDAAIFFGRSPEIALCMEDLREMRASGDTRLYAVVGASGSGKSSLMKAGVAPRLRREKSWLVLRSFRPGSDPLHTFADALARTAHDYGLRWSSGGILDELLTAMDVAANSERSASNVGPQSAAPQLNQAHAVLVRAVLDRIQQLRVAAGKLSATCLICIDQSEELARVDSRSATLFGRLLHGLVLPHDKQPTGLGVLVALTVRDDSYSELRASEALHGFTVRSSDLATLPIYRFADAVELPAARYGVVMEPTLVQALMRDAPEQRSLPLLAFALRRLWHRHASDSKITEQNYARFGKLPGLIEDAAERALRGMDPNDEAALRPAKVSKELDAQVAQLFFPALCDLNRFDQPTRRLAPSASFDERHLELLEPFRRWRLITSHNGVLEVAHEAMFREWSRFQVWLKPERGKLEQLRTLEVASENWALQNFSKDLLVHRNKLLHDCRLLSSDPRYKKQIDGSAGILRYLAECRKAQNRRRWASGLILTLVVGSILAAGVSNTNELTRIAYTTVNLDAMLPNQPVVTPALKQKIKGRQDVLDASIRSLTTELFYTRRTNGVTKANFGLAGGDPWAVGQAIAALPPTDEFAADIRAFFVSSFIGNCVCWAPVEGGGHAAATAWILIGQAAQRLTPPRDVVEQVLLKQSKSGGWAIFYDAAPIPETESTYATAITVLALHALLAADFGEAAPPKAQLQAAMDRGIKWLIANAPVGSDDWADYPNSKNRQVKSRGLNAFVTFVLLTVIPQSDATTMRFKNWLHSVAHPVSLQVVENSDQFVRLDDGRLRRDGTRFAAFSWELATMLRASSNLTVLERLKARSFIDRSLSNWPEDDFKQFDFLLAEVLYSLRFADNTAAGKPQP